MKKVRKCKKRCVAYNRHCVTGAVGEKGDSGGGFTMERDGAHHLYGVLSTKLNNNGIETNLRLFTNVLNDVHINWLRKNFDRLQQSK